MLNLGRVLMVTGLVIFVIGGILFFSSRFGLPLGRLPGDLRIERQNFTCILPLATSILLSLVLTILLNIVLRIINR